MWLVASDDQGYRTTTKVLHWLTVAMLAGQLVVGYLLDGGVSNQSVFAVAGVIMLCAGAVFPFLKPPKAPRRDVDVAGREALAPRGAAHAGALPAPR